MVAQGKVASAAWKNSLRELETILERTDIKFDVLRKIDRSISKVSLPLDELLQQATELLSNIYSIKSYGLFFGVDEQLLPICNSKSQFDERIALKKYLAIRTKLKRNNPTNKTQRSSPEYSLHTEGDYFIFVFPLLHDGIVFFIVDLPRNTADQSDFHEFANSFAEQVFTFSQYVLYRRRREAHRIAYEAFFDNKLQPSACWAALLSTLDKFLPDDAFGQFNPPPLRQLLTYLEGDSAMRIAAGEGSHASSFVLVDESVSGLVLKSRTNNFLLINPQQSKLYKGYGDKRAEAELVIRLDSEGSAVGIINIEHEMKNAFNSVYVECMRDAAKFLAPLVAGLQARYDSFRKKEIGLLYIFTDMLSRMGDTYGHLVSQPMLAARGAIAEIRYLVENYDGLTSRQAMMEETAKLSRAIDELEGHSDEFTEGLPEFISYGSQPIRMRIEQRLKSFKKLAAAENIDVQIEEREPNLCAYASSLFQEHIFNIVNNSFQQIRKRIFENSVKSGHIKIEIARTSGITPQEQMTGLNFIDVTISDNGGGASQADLKKIGRPGFTTKREHGSGFGVAAGKEYFESIGGDMTWRNIRGGFQTAIRMQEFLPGIHSETRLIDRIRAEAMK